MSFAASESNPDPRRLFLEARDARQRELNDALHRAREARAPSVFFLSTAIPGADKHRPGVSRLFSAAARSLALTRGWRTERAGSDILGPYCIGSSLLAPADAKQVSMRLETESPSARLLDVDVYVGDGAAMDRASLGLPPRPCLVCREPARECIRLLRHSPQEVLDAVRELLSPLIPCPGPLLPERLAKRLVLGAMRELDLTPKPGLVDRHDSGSHADLSYDRMRTSVELLPLYFDDILRCCREARPLPDFVAAGRLAEERMMGTIASNAHKGFIFLGGLVLMATWESSGDLGQLRRKIEEIATRFFGDVEGRSSPSHGRDVRARHGIGGIRAEVARGLPAVFEYGWPMYREALEAGWAPDRAGFYLMAVLMEHVEDTTAVHRCGAEGLRRLRSDGTRLRRLLEQQRPPEALLVGLNDDYRRMGLTMGGVADCMALTFAIHDAAML